LSGWGNICYPGSLNPTEKHNVLLQGALKLAVVIPFHKSRLKIAPYGSLLAKVDTKGRDWNNTLEPAIGMELKIPMGKLSLGGQALCTISSCVRDQPRWRIALSIVVQKLLMPRRHIMTRPTCGFLTYLQIATCWAIACNQLIGIPYFYRAHVFIAQCQGDILRKFYSNKRTLTRFTIVASLLFLQTTNLAAQTDIRNDNTDYQKPLDQVEDLSSRTSVSGASVTERGVLSLTGKRNVDYASLAGIRDVRDLILEDSDIVDLTPIAKMRGVEMLSLSGTKVTDLTPLSRLKSLRYLYLNGSDVTDLKPLAKMTWLEDIGVDFTLVEDLTPLEKLNNLRRLSVQGTLVSDITPLAKMKNITWLNLSDSLVSDISVIRNFKEMHELSLAGTLTEDISSLAALKAMRILHLDGTYVTDLTPLAKLDELTELSLGLTSVEDVSPLADLKNLRLVDLSVTSVSDISPLANLEKLRELRLNGSEVTDTSPLNGLLGKGLRIKK